MKKKLKLPFVQLQNELYEVISPEELRTIVGGVDASTLPWNSDADIINSLNAMITSGAFDFSGSGGLSSGGAGGSGGSGSGGFSGSGLSGSSPYGAWGDFFGAPVGVGSGNPAPLLFGSSNSNVSIVRSGGGWEVKYTNSMGFSATFSGPANLPTTGGTPPAVPGPGNPWSVGLKINF